MNSRPRPRGLAYVEAVLATVMVAVLLAPVLSTLSTGLLSQQVVEAQSTQALSLQSKLDEVLAKPYTVLLAETYTLGGNTKTSVSLALSDPQGSPRRIVTIYRTDDSEVSVVDTGLLRIRVAWEGAPSGSGLVTFRSKWL